MTEKYSYEDSLIESKKYFNGDELAAKVFIDKYALRDDQGNILENTPEKSHRRLAKEFARIEKKYKNSMSEEEIFSLFDKFKWIIPQGSPMSAIGNEHKIQSASNCFVIPSPVDSYGGILFTDQQQAQIMKRRGGVGFDISAIRPKGIATTNAAGTTDGISVFMERFSNTCREVAQNGRRGALMLTISCKHPEIETFISIKKNLKKVTGANISIRVTDDFMKAVKNDSDFNLQWPIDSKTPKIVKTVKAKDIWNQIIEAAWTSAEPGVLFWDNVINNGPADIYKEQGFESVSTNPCIVGDTLIAVADGRNAVSIKTLSEERKDVPVYSTNIKTGQKEIKIGRNPRKTGEKSEVWKLVLDDGSSLIATPNHKILLNNMEYIELKNLKKGDSICPFYSFNSNGYRQISGTGKKMKGGNFRNRRQYRIISEFYNGIIDSKKYAIHHKDRCSLNDDVKNLQIMSHEEHKKLHSENMIGEKNPYHKMTDEWKKNFATHLGKDNGRYIDITNKELLEHGKKLFKQEGKITSRNWNKYASKNGLPVFLSNEIRFGTFNNFKNQVCTNHKVISVEKYGYEDVYNITVDDNHNYHIINSYDDVKYITSSGICIKNCGEITLSPYDSCRLMVVNLLSFVKNPFTEKAKFDFVYFAEIVQKAQRLMDDMIDIELEQIDKILNKIKADPEDKNIKAIELDLWNNIRKTCENGRRTGLGITALGDTIASLNMRYGSEESIVKTEKIYKTLAINSEKSSCILAKERGTFPIFNKVLEKGHVFIERLLNADEELKELYNKYGRRNISTTTTAPVGSLSQLARTTSGIEPAFLVSYKRKKKINPTDTNVKVDYVDDMGDKWQEFIVYHPGFQNWMDVTGKTKLEDSPYYKSMSNDVDWAASVDIQAVAQKWISHSISKTCNLPNSATKELVSEIYMKAWEKGCKGFTIYRDGCRDGVLTAVDTVKKESVSDSSQLNEVRMTDKIIKVHAPKRPKVLKSDVYHIKVKGQEYFVIVGLWKDGTPYEVFAGKNGHISKDVKKGEVIKNNRGHYIFKFDNDKTIDNISKYISEDQEGITRNVSLAMRHGIDVSFIVHQMEKTNGTLDSFSKAISRALKKYIQNGTAVYGEQCSNCGGKLVRIEGCMSCLECQTSKCG